MARNTIEIMNDLIQLDVDAVHAYEQAIEACDIVTIQEKLRAFQGDHERHIEDLSRLVRARGAEPKVTRDAKGFLIKGFTAIMSRGDHSALMAMRGNEELTNLSYKNALDDVGAEAEVRTVVERNYADEQRHLAWIKDALDQKLYEKAA
jgi:uncharacterized protein (TIGR02284 family)